MAALQFVIRLIECEEKTDVVPFWEQLRDLGTGTWGIYSK
jgi:hypothetical protein